MFDMMKRWLALPLAVVLVLGLLPAGSARAAEQPEAKTLTQADYADADLVFAQIDAMESAPAKRNAAQAEKTQAAMEIVLASDSYAEGSLEVNGASFTWETDNGVRCIYSPRMQKIQAELTPENGENAIINEPRAVKGGSPTGNQVYLIGPYYGHDTDFTDQYKKEARRVASAIGDTDGYTVYSGTAATVDKIAEAVGNGAVVFFDSHGITDYENPNDSWDCITGATQSYLCLTSTTGLTDADYDDGALYFSDGICINGATIANHMTQNSPAGILWMAICWGMGTDTICAPLRQKGVEVVYGYSESVTFAGDYLYEETFWNEMITGSTVADSVAKMKATWGNWDWSVPMAEYYGYDDGYADIDEVLADFYAFPVVVSDEDVFPGKRTTTSCGASSLQTVKSTYTLGEVFDVTEPTVPDIPAENGATLSFADTDNRIEFSTEKQVWNQNGITVTNTKSESSSNVANYYDPVRFYAGSSVTIQADNMVKLEIDCTGLATKYVTAWTKTCAAQGITASSSGGIVTVELDAPVDSLTLASLTAQARAYSITVYVQAVQQEALTGDLTDDGVVNNDDVLLLLWHTVFPEQYPLEESADITGDGAVNNDDVVLLLWHTVFPDQYPL